MGIEVRADGSRAPAQGQVKKVVVVGAGVSGLTAARALHEAGVDVVVVEGRDRIGGRTHTVDVGSVPVDLGASWIHAGTESPMLPYIEALGIERLSAALAAIDRVGFGAFEKVALGYDHAVWQTDGRSAHLTVIDGQCPQWPVVLDLSAWYGSPVVVGLAVGASARALATMTEDEKIASLHRVIETVSGPATPPPTSQAVTSWTNDPFLLGCYTNVDPTSSLEQHAADVRTLGEPHGRVMFAGEHTDDTGTSTVDSAWRTGLREAARLLQTDRLRL